MNIREFWKLIWQHGFLIALAGAAAASTAWVFTVDDDLVFKAETVIDCGIVSEMGLDDEAKLDWNLKNSQFENLQSLIRSRETLLETNTRLLTHCLLLSQPDVAYFSRKWFFDLEENLPGQLRTQLLAPDDPETTFRNIVALRDKSDPNPVRSLLLGKHPIFGIESILENLKTRREGESDLLRIEYQCPDRAVCKKTLELLSEIFIEKRRRSVQGQAASLIDFFQRVMNETAENLTGKEDEMLDFMSRNKIINFYEQTRFIAGKREDFNENYYRELMARLSADSARAGIERRLKQRLNLPVVNNRLIEQRDQLSKINKEMAEIEIAPAYDSTAVPPKSNPRWKALNSQANKMKTELQTNAQAVFSIERTPEGAETRALLDQWVSHWVAVQECDARLKVMEMRRREFDQTFTQFAPIGSNIKRLEREIGLAEHAYLENLKSYNQALLHQRSLALASNMKILDRPYLPEEPLKSKKWMVVVAAGMAGSLLTLTVLILLAMYDARLRNAERAAGITGLPVVAVLPIVSLKNRPKSAILPHPKVERIASELLFQLQLDLKNQQAGQPARVAVASQKRQEGKSFVAGQVISKIRLGGERVLWLRPETDKTADNHHSDDHFYTPNDRFLKFKNESEIAGSSLVRAENFHFVFLEMPPLTDGAYPLEWLAQANATWVVADAGRSWGATEKRKIDLLKSAVSHPCKLVLNGVQASEI